MTNQELDNETWLLKGYIKYYVEVLVHNAKSKLNSTMYEIDFYHYYHTLGIASMRNSNEPIIKPLSFDSWWPFVGLPKEDGISTGCFIHDSIIKK